MNARFTATQSATLQVFGRLLRTLGLSEMDTSNKNEMADWLIREMGKLREESRESLPVPSLCYQDFHDIDEFNVFVTREKNPPKIVSIEKVERRIRAWYQDPLSETPVGWEPRIGDYQPRNFLNAILMVQETIYGMCTTLSLMKSDRNPYVWTRNTFTLYLSQLFTSILPNEPINCNRSDDLFPQGTGPIEQLNLWVKQERPEILAIETIKSSSGPAIMVWYTDLIL